jgi:Rieske Fe-S protein
MKTIQLLIILTYIILQTNTITAQNFTYTYDAAGNRIQRQVIYLKSAQVNKQQPQENQTTGIVQDVVGEQKITIFPNPTKGKLGIQFHQSGNMAFNYSGNSGNLIVVYDLSGKTVAQKEINSQFCEIDLTDVRTGVYVMRISMEGKSQEWKVVKE